MVFSSNPVSDRPLSAFESRWLAEAVRHYETREGVLDDRAAVAVARQSEADLERRLCVRAAHLGRHLGLRSAIQAWRLRASWLLALVCLFAVLLGSGSAGAVLGDAGRPVNVIWALGALLGVHAISLIVWLISVTAGGQAGGSGLGRLWLQGVAWLDRRTAQPDVPVALAGLMSRDRTAAWGLSALSHLFWLLALLAALVGLLLLLATRRYGFVWETTILPADVFAGLVAMTGAGPAFFGFAVPDAAMVATAGAGGGLDEAARRAWSSWLLGCLVLYGVMPRLVLTGLCVLAWRRGLARQHLDLTQPAYLRLRARLLPDSERAGVCDPAPAKGVGPVAPARPGLVPGDGCALALELGDDLVWPPVWLSTTVEDGGRIDSREQRKAIIGRFLQRPPSRLLIAVDPRMTPDRGSLGLIAELAGTAGSVMVWAYPGPDGQVGRMGLWRDRLASLGLPEAAVCDDAARAAAWLETGR